MSFPGGGYVPPKPPKKDEPEEPDPTVGTMSTSEKKVYDWRLEQFTRLGFGETQAELLASDRHIDLNVVRRWIKQGCDHDTAFKLLV